jgi:hypothetical protein
MDGTHSKDRDDRRTSLERYLRMDEKQKDTEIQKAVMRLQKRIQEILYMLETEKQHIAGPESGEKKAPSPPSKGR